MTTRHIAQRIVNAEDNFAETLMRCADISEDDARAVAAFYLKSKLAKLDAVGGRIAVKHGVFLEADVIRKAVDQA